MPFSKVDITMVRETSVVPPWCLYQVNPMKIQMQAFCCEYFESFTWPCNVSTQIKRFVVWFVFCICIYIILTQWYSFQPHTFTNVRIIPYSYRCYLLARSSIWDRTPLIQKDHIITVRKESIKHSIAYVLLIAWAELDDEATMVNSFVSDTLQPSIGSPIGCTEARGGQWMIVSREWVIRWYRWFVHHIMRIKDQSTIKVPNSIMTQCPISLPSYKL